MRIPTLRSSTLSYPTPRSRVSRPLGSDCNCWNKIECVRTRDTQMWRPNSGRTVWLSVALLIIRTGTAKVSFLPSFLGDLCQRDNPCVDEARCVIDPAAPVVGRPFCICPSGEHTVHSNCLLHCSHRLRRGWSCRWRGL